MLLGHSADQAPIVTRLDRNEVRNAESALAQIAEEFPGLTLLELLDYYRRVSPVLDVDDAGSFQAAFRRVRKYYADMNLADVCSWFMDNYRPSDRSITLGHALGFYLQDLVEQKQLGSIGEWQFRSIGFATGRIERAFNPSLPLSDLTTHRLEEFIKAPTLPKRKRTPTKKSSRDKSAGSSVPPQPKLISNKTRSNRRSYLIGFFKFCMSKGWIGSNPARAIPSLKRRDFNRPEPCVMTPTAAAALMRHLEDNFGGRLVPFFVLTLFCGVRPTYKDGEIARITPARLNLLDRELQLRRADTKTKRGRVIKLQANVVAWLKAYPLEKYPILPPNFKKLYFEIRKQFKLGHDMLRHTFCSMLVGQSRSVGDAALQAGNSESVMWESYLNLVTRADAEKFWGILPQKLPEPTPPLVS